MHQKHLEGLVKRRWPGALPEFLQGLGYGQRICISNQFPSDTAVAVAGAGNLKQGAQTPVSTGQTEKWIFGGRLPGGPSDLGQSWEGMQGEGSPSHTTVGPPGPLLGDAGAGTSSLPSPAASWYSLSQHLPDL